MARKSPRQLTEAELRLMKVLWNREPATVGEILDSLNDQPPLAYSTVLTTLRILETKGFVRHKKQGRAFVYEAAVAREDATAGALKHLLSRFFDDSPELLVANLLKSEKIGSKELARLKRLIAEQTRSEQK
jgi:predicted transcriptional regulator